MHVNPTACMRRARPIWTQGQNDSRIPGAPIADRGAPMFQIRLLCELPWLQILVPSI